MCVLEIKVFPVKGIYLGLIFLVAQTVKDLPAVQETWILSLGLEDPLEKGMATHSSILAGKNFMDREAWWVHSVSKSRL